MSLRAQALRSRAGDAAAYEPWAALSAFAAASNLPILFCAMMPSAAFLSFLRAAEAAAQPGVRACARDARPRGAASHACSRCTS